MHEYRIIEIEVPNRIFKGSKKKYLLQRIGGFRWDKYKWVSYSPVMEKWREVTNVDYKNGTIRKFTFGTEQKAIDALQSVLDKLKEEDRDYLKENTTNTFKIKIEKIENE